MSYTWLAMVATAANFARNATVPYSLGAAYPVTRNGLTFGFVSSSGGTTTMTMADFTGAGYPKTAPGPDLYSGRASMTSASKVLRIDLPDGPGTYRLKASLGNKNGSLPQSIGGYEDPGRNSELFHVVSQTNPPAGGSMDAGGNIYTGPDLWWAALDQDGGNDGGGAYVEFTTQQDHIFLTLYNAYCYINAIGLEFQASAPPAVVLADLTLATTTFDINGAQPGDVISAIVNATAGSTLALSNTLSNQLAIDSLNRNLIVGSGTLSTGAKSVALTETLAGATNTPHPSTASVTFTNSAGGGGGGTPATDVVPIEFATYGAQMGGAPVVTAVIAGQPEFEPFCKLSVPTGTTFGNLSITGGGLQPYLRLKDYGGGVFGLEHTGTRIPDNFATRTLTIHNAANSVDTALSFASIVNAPGRPTTGDHGDMPTQIWNVRKKVKDMIFNNGWRGYVGQPIIQTVQVNSTASFAQAFNNLNPNGTSWYAIEFAAGVYEGGFGVLNVKDFGSGGLLLTRAAGADPEINFYGSFRAARNIDFGDLRYPGVPQVTPDTTASNKSQFTFMDPGSSGTTVYHRIATNDVRVGYLHSDIAQADLAAAEQWLVNNSNRCYNDFMLIYHAESYWEDGADFRGTQNHVKVYSTRYAMRKPQVTKPNQDIGVFTQVYGQGTTKGVFADDDCYAWYEPVMHNGLDYDGLASQAHSDVNQFRTFNSGTSPPRYTGKGWAANSGATTPFNTSNKSKMMSQYNGTIWQVVSVGATGLVGGDQNGHAIPPEMTADPATLTIGQQVQDGDVLFKYVGKAPGWGCKQYLVYFGGVVHSAAYSSTGLPASVQLCINSNAGYGYPTEVLIENFLCMTPNGRGIENGNFRGASIGTLNYQINPNYPRNKVWGWRATFLGPANSNSRIDATKFWASAINGVDVFFRKCIVNKIDGVANYSTQNQHDNLVLNYNGTSPGPTVRGGPGMFSRIQKTVDTQPTDYYGFPTFVDDGYDRDTFVSDVSKITHHNTGAYGARLREVHTITVGGDSFDLVINPPNP